MRFKNVVIESMAYALPEERWTSEDIERALEPLYERLHLPYGRLALMTGIEERRYWPASFKASEAAFLAGQAVLKKTALAIHNIDVLVHASVCRDRLEPPTAAYVHEQLKLSPQTQIFDLSNACLGVLNSMIVGASMIEAGTANAVLIVSGENSRPLLDWTLKVLNENTSLNRQSIKPLFANLTIGSGAVAVLLCHKKLACSPKPLLVGGIAQTDSSACSLCEGGTQSNNHLVMQTDSPALLKSGIALSKRAWDAFKQEMAWEAETAQCIVTHQVGRQHQLQLYEALQLDPQKDFSTFTQLGNMGSVSLPLTLCQADEASRLKPAMPVLLLGIGSGLSTLMMGLLWQK